MIDAALVLLALLAVASWTLLVVAHVDDRYGVDHVAGVRMALAASATDGVLYPPLFANGAYGGTRYMPLSIVLHAGLAAVTGEYLIAGKVLGIVTMALLVTTLWRLLRYVGCPRPLAAALATAVLTGEPGVGATFGMRADALPALLQVGAVGAVMAAPGTVGVVLAAVLAGVAVMSKLTALWAAVAILVWLIATDRPRAVLFCASYMAVVLVLAIVFLIASEGRLVDVFTLTFAGVGGAPDAITAPNRLLRVLLSESAVTWALVPFAGFGFVLARRGHHSALLILSFAMSAAITLVVFTDIGVGVNQLIDLAALVLLGTGLLSAGGSRAKLLLGDQLDLSRTATPTMVGLVVLWLVGSSLVYTMGTEIPSAVAAIGGGRPTQPLADQIGPDTAVLSEDPGVLVALGRRPTVLDPFMLLRLERREPAAVATLARRIEAAEFDLVVLLEPLEEDSVWWQRYHFGDTIINALRDAYVPAGTSDGYYLYEPARWSPRGAMARAAAPARPPVTR